MMEKLTNVTLVKIKNGLLSNASYIPSINFNARPQGIEIDLLVIHCASLPKGEYANNNLEQLFSGNISLEKLRELHLPEDLRVSTHIYINRSGIVYQFVPLHQRAWHAGISHFKGREGCNDFSIGIELQGTDESEFTKDQYQSLILVTKSITAVYSKITKDNIVGHSIIAPTRKTDPGVMFDWELYLSKL